MEDEVRDEVIGPSAILLEEDRKKPPAEPQTTPEGPHPLLQALASREAMLVLVVAGAASALLPWYVGSPSGTGSYTLIGAMSSSNCAGMELGGLLFFMGLAMMSFSSAWWVAAGDLTVLVGLLAGYAGMLSVKLPNGATWTNGEGSYVAWAVLVMSFILLLVRLRYED
jgi:hypothetical protein